jgi:hypothetical protein
MTIATQIAWDDTVLPFQLDASGIRGRVARLDGVLDQVLKQHAYPPVIEALVAETALLTALIGQTIKLRWKLSLQVRGKGAARLIATDYYGPTEDGEPARIRAYASYDADRLDHAADPFSQIGEGYFAVMIDQGEGMVPYQGFTPIAGWQPVGLRRDLFRPVRTDPDPLPAALAKAPSPAARCIGAPGASCCSTCRRGGCRRRTGQRRGRASDPCRHPGRRQNPKTGTAPTCFSTRSRSWR